jgi:HK97 family phage major capsid protein
LVAAHAAVTDGQLIGGSGTNGEVVGIRNTPNITTIAVSTLDVQSCYSAIANGIQQIHSTRFLPPDAIAMHPRRWGWFLSLLDGNQRPLFLPAANSPMNVAGVQDVVASQQVVGQIQGLPVITDPNIPVNLGAGNNEDVIFVMRASDRVLWEDDIRARVLPEVTAQNLTVVLQIYNYFAFTASRFPQSVVEISGMTAPTF